MKEFLFAVLMSALGLISVIAILGGLTVGLILLVELAHCTIGVCE